MAGGVTPGAFRIPDKNLALRAIGLPHSLQNLSRQREFRPRRASLQRQARKLIS